HGDIFVNASVNWSANHSLTLSAYRDIVVPDGRSLTSTGGGNIVLRADSTGKGVGTVSFSGDGTGHINVSSGGSASIDYTPSSTLDFPVKYENPTNFSPRVSGPLTAYMLVNNASDLAQIGTDSGTLGRTYALGMDIDAGTFPG